MLAQRIEELLRRKDLRSADRANMRRMLQQLKRGQPLTPQESYTLWSYFNRYEGPLRTTAE